MIIYENTQRLVIWTRYYGPRGRQGSRIVAYCGENGAARKGVSYDPALSGFGNHCAAVRALCAARGWPGDLIGAKAAKGYVFTFLTDEVRGTK